MKKIIFAIILIVASAFCFAQENTERTTTEVAVENESQVFVGHWYNPKGSLMSHIEFYEDGTGCVYPKSIKNSTKFTWTVEDGILVMKGGVKNKSEFSFEGEKLTFKKLNTFKNITYEKVIE